MSNRNPTPPPPNGRITVESLQNHVQALGHKLNQSEQPTVGPFPTGVFPAPLQQVIEQTARHSLYKPDWIGSAILYATSVAVGNCYGTRYGTYEQKAVMYLALVGMPGTNKSGPLEYAVKPLRQIDKVAYHQFRQQKEEYEHWESLTKKQRKDEGLSDTMTPPVYRTTLVSDVTQEFLVQTHQCNPVGLGLFMDELAGWFKNFTRYNKGSEEQFWLSAWSFSPIKSGRKTAGIQHVDDPFLPVAGTIQPGVLSELAKDGRNQNGFTDRILFAYPDDQQKPKDSDSQLAPAITEGYCQYIDNLLRIRESITTDEYGTIQTNWLPFASDAFNAMRTWRDANTDRTNQTDNPAYKGIYAKMDAYCIRFALLIELMDWACNESDLSCIRLTSVERGILLTEYFRQNAEKVHFVLNEQTPAERLPNTQQRLFNGLPDEVTTADAIAYAKQMMPPVSERTVKRILKDNQLFRRVKHGEYYKCC